MDLNRVMMIGNLTRDPETRSTNSGKSVTSFTIAVNDRKGGKDGEGTAMFIRVSAWDRTGELVQQYMTKGSQVLVEGRLKIEEYKAKDGTDRREPTIVADRVSFGAKPRADGAGGGGSYAGGGASRPQSSSPKRDSAPAADDRDYDGNSGSTDDDLPF